MFTDPVTLIDRALRNLEDVAELLADEFNPELHPRPTESGRICRDAHVTIRTLVPKLKVARITQLSDPIPSQRPICIDCD